MPIYKDLLPNNLIDDLLDAHKAKVTYELKTRPYGYDSGTWLSLVNRYLSAKERLIKQIEETPVTAGLS